MRHTHQAVGARREGAPELEVLAGAEEVELVVRLERVGHGVVEHDERRVRVAHQQQHRLLREHAHLRRLEGVEREVEDPLPLRHLRIT